MSKVQKKHSSRKATKASKKSSGSVPADHYGYLHGYDKTEQDRLLRQARFFEAGVYQDIYWPAGPSKILEPGCGVGAQTELLLKRFPEITVTGVDRSKSQLSRAAHVHADSIKSKRVNFVEAPGERLPFEDSTYDGAFVCWFLEHVSEPVKILKEIRRVLQPGAVIYCTEVLNSSFFLHPYAPSTLQYWFAFNDHQWNMGGDPFCGAKLGMHLYDAGFQNIEIKVKDFLLDKRMPKQRDEHLKMYYELLKSAAPSLLQAKAIDSELINGLEKEWEAARNDPNSVLFYSFIQAKAIAL